MRRATTTGYLGKALTRVEGRFDIAIYTWWYPRWVRFEEVQPLHDYTYYSTVGMRGTTTVGTPMSLVAAQVVLPTGN